MDATAVRLRRLRDRLGYSQEGIAHSVGMSQRSWDRWETATPEAFLSLARIAEKYQVSADYLLGLSDDPTPPGRAEAPPPHAEELVDLLRSLSPYNGDRLLAIAEALFDHQQRAAERAGERDEALRLLASHVGRPAAAMIDELVAEAVTTGRTAVLLSGLARLGLPKEGEDLPEE